MESEPEDSYKLVLAINKAHLLLSTAMLADDYIPRGLEVNQLLGRWIEKWCDPKDKNPIEKEVANIMIGEVLVLLYPNYSLEQLLQERDKRIEAYQRSQLSNKLD